MAERALMFRTQTWVTSKASPETVFDVILDPPRILSGQGNRATDEGYKLLSLEAPEGPASVGTRFTSTGNAGRDTFHDRSIITEASRPNRFVIETDSRLVMKSARTWEAHRSLRYDVASQGEDSRITHTETVERVNYVPYWLKPWARPIFRPFVNRADRGQLQNLARLAEERSAG